jgi:hypothetical protein
VDDLDNWIIGVGGEEIVQIRDAKAAGRQYSEL